MTPEEARALGKRSGEARRKLSLADVEAALGALESPADARRWAEQASRWALAGVIPGSIANGVASLMREWRALWELQVDLHALARLERRIKELEGELAAARAAAGRAAP